jgi:transcriptional regulator with XRE-family HTH domain
MSNETNTVQELRRFRTARGLTQTDLARLLGVTQQAVAKWEETGQIPAGRVRDLAKHLRVSADVLLVEDDPALRERRVPVEVNEIFFSTQVVVDFEERSFHYCPREEEVADFWHALQKGTFAHLSAGPVQVLINTGSMRRVDLSEDPPLSSYKPFPINPTDELKRRANDRDDTDASAEPEEREERQWYENGEARVYIRGVAEPYVATQTFFDELLGRDDVSTAELVDLAENFECERDDSNSIFDLFEDIRSSAEREERTYERNEDPPSEKYVFQSEDYDGCPQATWVHSREIQVIEVPTRLWELYRMAMDAWSEAPPVAKRPGGRQIKKKGK